MAGVGTGSDLLLQSVWGTVRRGFGGRGCVKGSRSPPGLRLEAAGGAEQSPSDGNPRERLERTFCAWAATVHSDVSVVSRGELPMPRGARHQNGLVGLSVSSHSLGKLVCLQRGPLAWPCHKVPCPPPTDHPPRWPPRDLEEPRPLRYGATSVRAFQAASVLITARLCRCRPWLPVAGGQPCWMRRTRLRPEAWSAAPSACSQARAPLAQRRLCSTHSTDRTTCRLSSVKLNFSLSTTSVPRELSRMLGGLDTLAFFSQLWPELPVSLLSPDSVSSGVQPAEWGCASVRSTHVPTGCSCDRRLRGVQGGALLCLSLWALCLQPAGSAPAAHRAGCRRLPITGPCKNPPP